MTYFLLGSVAGAVVVVFETAVLDSLLLGGSNDDFRCGYTRIEEMD